MHSSHEGLKEEDLVLVCKHVIEPEAWDDDFEVNLAGGKAPIVVCNVCRGAMVDAQEGRITQQEATKDVQLSCRECALELITRKWLPLRPGDVVGLGRCDHCGEQIFVRANLARSLYRFMATNSDYGFDVKVDERRMQITVKKRGSTRIAELPPATSGRE